MKEKGSREGHQIFTLIHPSFNDCANPQFLKLNLSHVDVKTLFIFSETLSDSSKLHLFSGCTSISYYWYWHYSTHISIRNNPGDYCLCLRAEIFHRLIQVGLISFVYLTMSPSEMFSCVLQ